MLVPSPHAGTGLCGGCAQCDDPTVSCDPFCTEISNARSVAPWKVRTRGCDVTCSWGACHGCAQCAEATCLPGEGALMSKAAAAKSLAEVEAAIVSAASTKTIKTKAAAAPANETVVTKTKAAAASATGTNASVTEVAAVDAHTLPPSSPSSLPPSATEWFPEDDSGPIDADADEEEDGSENTSSTHNRNASKPQERRQIVAGRCFPYCSQQSST